MDKNENIVQARGRHTSEWGKKRVWNECHRTPRKEKSTKYDIFHKFLRSVILKQFPNNSKYGFRL